MKLSLDVKRAIEQFVLKTVCPSLRMLPQMIVISEHETVFPRTSVIYPSTDEKLDEQFLIKSDELPTVRQQNLEYPEMPPQNVMAPHSTA